MNNDSNDDANKLFLRYSLLAIEISILNFNLTDLYLLKAVGVVSHQGVAKVTSTHHLEINARQGLTSTVLPLLQPSDSLIETQAVGNIFGRNDDAANRPNDTSTFGRDSDEDGSFFKEAMSAKLSEFG